MTKLITDGRDSHKFVDEMGRGGTKDAANFATRLVKRNIFTCITAHQVACNAGILHHNISSSNIMLVDLEENIQDGMLINWDLSKSFDPEKPDAAHQLT